MGKSGMPSDKPKAGNVEFELQPLAPVGGWPLNFAYLIKTNVPLTDVYPIIGEILFGIKIPPQHCKNPSNIIYVALDDSVDFLFRNILESIGETYENIKSIKKVSELKGAQFHMEGENGLKFLERNTYWMDAFGEFGGDEEQRHGNSLQPRKIPTSGNPMKIYRFIDSAIKDINEKKQYGAKWTIYFINSLSSLYRIVGMEETVALLRKILERMWEQAAQKGERNNRREKDKNSSNNTNNNEVEKDGILFALLQENVMKEDEESYIATFFDGVIEIKSVRLKTGEDHIPMKDKDKNVLEAKRARTGEYLENGIDVIFINITKAPGVSSNVGKAACIPLYRKDLGFEKKAVFTRYAFFTS